MIGNKELAMIIKNECKTFLKEKLLIELSEEKTRITNITTKEAHFLGVDIRRDVSKESKIVLRRIKGRIVKSRINQTRIQFGIPVEKTLKRLKDKGFTKTYTKKKKNGKLKLVPEAITKWIFLDHRSILIRYNMVIRGLINYYGFVDNLRAFHSIINYLLHHSCAKTLARKLNLGNRAKAFKRFGRLLETPEVKGINTSKLFTQPNFKKNVKLLEKYNPSSYDPFEVVN